MRANTVAFDRGFVSAERSVARSARRMSGAVLRFERTTDSASKAVAELNSLLGEARSSADATTTAIDAYGRQTLIAAGALDTLLANSPVLAIAAVGGAAVQAAGGFQKLAGIVLSFGRYFNIVFGTAGAILTAANFIILLAKARREASEGIEDLADLEGQLRRTADQIKRFQAVAEGGGLINDRMRVHGEARAQNITMKEAADQIVAKRSAELAELLGRMAELRGPTDFQDPAALKFDTTRPAVPHDDGSRAEEIRQRTAAFEALRASLDPVFAAQQALNEAQANYSALIAEGTISQAEFNAVIADLEANLRTAQMQFDGTTEATARATAEAVEHEQALLAASERAKQVIEQDRLRKVAAEEFFEALEFQNQVLVLQNQGLEAQAAFLEQEAELRSILGKELLPEQTRRLRELIEESERLRQVAEQRREGEVAQEKATRRTEQAARDLTSVMTQGLQNMVQGGQEFDNVLQNILISLTRIAEKAATEFLVKFVVQALGAVLGPGLGPGHTTGPGGFLVGGGTGILPGAGFAHGGRFDVGGVGGPDSQLTAFMATPGEHVQVTPPGGFRDASGPDITVNQTVVIATGVQATVEAEILNKLPLIRAQAVAAVVAAVQAGGPTAKAIRGA